MKMKMLKWKKKSCEPFRSCLLNSSPNLANFHPNWTWIGAWFLFVLKQGFQKMYTCNLKNSLKISDREWIERTIAQNDKDGDGGISLEEFIEMNISRNKRQNPQISVDRRSQADILQEKAKLAFNAYDRNRDGYLTKAQCWKIGNQMLFISTSFAGDFAYWEEISKNRQYPRRIENYKCKFTEKCFFSGGELNTL